MRSVSPSGIEDGGADGEERRVPRPHADAAEEAAPARARRGPASTSAMPGEHVAHLDALQGEARRRAAGRSAPGGVAAGRGSPGRDHADRTRVGDLAPDALRIAASVSSRVARVTSTLTRPPTPSWTTKPPAPIAASDLEDVGEVHVAQAQGERPPPGVLGRGCAALDDEGAAPCPGRPGRAPGPARTGPPPARAARRRDRRPGSCRAPRSGGRRPASPWRNSETRRKPRSSRRSNARSGPSPTARPRRVNSSPSEA